MIWFTADTHFGHGGILAHQRHRQFADTKEMDEHLFEQMNSVLRGGDELWHLGDFCWRASRAGHYRNRIRRGVQLHLVAGNHDANSLARHCSSYQQMVVRKFGGKKFHLCHYPLLTWCGSSNGSFHLHGHSHGNLRPPRGVAMTAEQLDRFAAFGDRAVGYAGRMLRDHYGRMDVGVDSAYHLLGQLRPFSLDEVFWWLGIEDDR